MARLRTCTSLPVLVVLSTTALSGCAADEEWWSWPALPSDTRSLVIAAETDRTFRVFAFPYDSEAPIHVPESADAITVFGYSRTLEELGLDEGPVVRGEEGRCWSRPLSEGASMFRRTLEDSGWSNLSSAPSSVAGFLALARCPCPSFVQEEAFTLDIPASGKPIFFEIGQRLYLLSPGGTVAWPRHDISAAAAEILSPNPAPFSLMGAFLAPDGTIYGTAGDDVRVLDLASARISTSTVMSIRPHGIDGGDRDGELEIYLASDKGRVFTLRAGSWSDVPYQASGVAPDSDQSGLVHWYGPGRALLALHDARALLLIEPGRPPQFVPREGFASVSDLAVAADGTAFLGSRTGAIAILDGPRIRELSGLVRPSDGAGVIRRLFPVGAGMGFVAELGFIGEVIKDAGVCSMHETSGFRELIDGFGNDEEFIVAGSTLEDRLRVARYRRVAP